MTRGLGSRRKEGRERRTEDEWCVRTKRKERVERGKRSRKKEEDYERGTKEEKVEGK